MPELLAAQQTITNAYGLYLRTRPTASPQSVKRAKELPFGGLHPTLLAALPKTKYTNARVGCAGRGRGGPRVGQGLATCRAWLKAWLCILSGPCLQNKGQAV